LDNALSGYLVLFTPTRLVKATTFSSSTGEVAIGVKTIGRRELQSLSVPRRPVGLGEEGHRSDMARPARSR